MTSFIFCVKLEVVWCTDKAISKSSEHYDNKRLTSSLSIDICQFLYFNFYTKSWSSTGCRVLIFIMAPLSKTILPNLHLTLVQIEWMVLTLAQGMLYFSPMASVMFSPLVSSYLIAPVHLELPPHGLLHSRDNSHRKKRIGIIIIWVIENLQCTVYIFGGMI